MLAIEHAEYYSPENLIKIRDAAAWLNIPADQARVFERIYGLKTIPYAENQTMAELLSSALKKVLEHYPKQKDSFTHLIHAHTAQTLLPFGSSIADQMKKIFKLPVHAFSTSLNNCASPLDALSIAEMLLADDERSRIIILIGEKTFTPAVRLIPNISVAGDVAVALVVKRKHDTHNLLALNVQNYGEFSQGLWMNETQRLKFEISFPTLLKASIDKSLTDVNICLNDVKILLPHNVNIRLWQQIAKVIGIPFEKVYTKNIPKYAHCFGADIFINMITARDDQCTQKGDYYLMITAGMGATVGSAIFQH